MRARWRASAPGAVATALALGACGATGPADERVHRAITPLIRVAVRPDGLTVRVGDTVRMRAVAVPDVPVGWRWSVSPPAFAVVDPMGLVLTLAPGEVDVVACTDTPEPVCGSAPLRVRP